MADENEAIAEPELETAIDAEQGPDDTEEVDAEETEVDGDETEGDDQGDDDDSGLEDIEIDGKTYSVPKELKGAFMKNADYTQKSQTNAERARALEARQAEIEERANATDEELDLRASLKTMDKTLAEYAKLTKEDWAHHRAADYIGTEDAWREYQDLKAQREDTAKALEGKQNERTESTAKDLSNRVQETLAAATEILPGLTPEARTAKIGSLVEFATSGLDVPEHVLKANWSPQLLKWLNLAHIGSLAMAKKASPPKKDPVTTPLTTLKAKSNPKPAGLDDRLSIGEWQKRREAQVRARARG